MAMEFLVNLSGVVTRPGQRVRARFPLQSPNYAERWEINET
jgi:hypothetical protein